MLVNLELYSTYRCIVLTGKVHKWANFFRAEQNKSVLTKKVSKEKTISS